MLEDSNNAIEKLHRDQQFFYISQIARHMYVVSESNGLEIFGTPYVML